MTPVEYEPFPIKKVSVDFDVPDDPYQPYSYEPEPVHAEPYHEPEPYHHEPEPYHHEPEPYHHEPEPYNHEPEPYHHEPYHEPEPTYVEIPAEACVPEHEHLAVVLEYEDTIKHLQERIEELESKQ